MGSLWMLMLLLGLELSRSVTIASALAEYSSDTYAEESDEYNITTLNTTVEERETTVVGNSSEYNTTTLYAILEEATASEGNLSEYDATTTATSGEQNVKGNNGPDGSSTTSIYTTTTQDELDEYYTTPSTTVEAVVDEQLSGYDTFTTDAAVAGEIADDLATYDRVGDATIWFINSIVSRKRSFLFVEGAMIQDAFLSLPSDSLCTCRTQCNIHLGCKAASFVDQGDASVCRLSTGNLTSTSFIPGYNASFMLWNRFPDGRYWLGADNRVYLTFEEMVLAKDAQDLCRRIPGFRLGIFTSPKAFHVLVRFYEIDYTDVAIDLTLVEGVPTWGDGTTHNETLPFVPFDIQGLELPFYTLSSGAFKDRLGDGVVRLLCQAELGSGWL